MEKPRLAGRLWVEKGDRNFFGQGRIELLRMIDLHGSISKAAKATGISYKAAWDAVDTMNNLSSEPLVIRATGGRHGGGTILTDSGRRLIEAFTLIEEEHQRFIDRLGLTIHDLNDVGSIIRRLTMRTSARNELYAIVRNVKKGAVTSEVELSLKGGDVIVALVTNDSVDALQLEPGAEAFALIKSTLVILATGDAPLNISARNRLKGTVSRINRGAVNTEVTLALPGGSTISALVTNDGADELNITEHEPATAIFKASSVIVGVN